MSTETMLQATVLNSPDRTRGDSLMTPTNTTELIEALERTDERASVKIMVKDYADGWFEAAVSKRISVGELIQALAIQPQAEAQPGVGELRQVLELFAKDIFSLGWNEGENEHTRSRGGEDYRSGKTKERFESDIEKAMDAILAALPQPTGSVSKLVERQHNDIGILISMIDGLAEATGEGPEEEDGVLFAQIKQSHNEAIAALPPFQMGESSCG